MKVDLYADGGVIESNPSEIGGTWAIVLVESETGILKYQASGVYTPEKMRVDKVTNNQMELLALLRGLNYVKSFCFELGCVYSDSNVSLGRLFKGWGMANIPEWLMQKKKDIMSHYNVMKMRWQLLDGHPTKAQLSAGFGKRGHPVSVWNQLCDTLCNQEAKNFLIKN